MIRRLALVAGLLLALASCAAQPVVVGSKSSTQDQIVAEMMASLLEDAGIPVSRRIALGDTATVFEALRSGAIDLYPEYTGTALAQIGAPPTPDRGAALEQVRTAFAERGIAVLAPLGFESTYVAVARPDFVARRGVETIDGLDRIAGELRIGASEDFAGRPRDGLRPFLDRFGLSDASVTVVADAEREDLYAALIRDELDLVIGFSTDPEITDFELQVLRAAAPFFPAYEAAPMASQAALAAHPQMAEALAPLADALNAADIRRLVRQVSIAGRSPQAVARTELGRLGLREGVVEDPLTPLAIAVDPAETGGRLANSALRAVRTAMPGRRVSLMPADAPAELLPDRQARLALLPSIGHFTVQADDGSLTRRSDIEAVAVVGTADVYAFAAPDGPDALAGAARIAAGPAGSPAHTLARLVARSRSPAAEVVALEASGAAAVGAALAEGAADAGLVIASRDRRDVEALLRRGEVRLIDAASWWEGPARLDAPFLRELSIPVAARDFLSEEVTTLAMQYTLAGPAPLPESRLGRSGPVSFSTGARPLSDSTVRALNAALGPGRQRVGPHLRRAAALDPVIAPPPSALNPAPGQAVLAVGILGYLALAVWLYIRAGRRG